MTEKGKKRGLIIAALLACVTLASAGAAGTLYGAAAAVADASLTVEDMLTYAIQDEYLARAEYIAIMGKYGAIRPFSNIVKAEETHVAYLRDAFANYGLALPADEASSRVAAPATLLAANQAGVQAEIDNIAMYDRFLADPALKDAKYADLRALFTTLKRASESHLRAFRNQLAKY